LNWRSSATQHMHMYWQSSDKLLIIGSKVALAALQ
jgi:hypothetical protein